MKVIRSRAPLRLGLAGGGTDVSPFSDLHGGQVLNATIDLYAHTILEPRSDGKLVLVACDREEHVCLDAAAPIVDDEPLRLHRGIHRRIVRDFNDGQPLSCTVTTFADAPAGSGLGTSSTMVVSVLQAYAEWLKLDLTEYELANLAYQIEREDLALAGGKQDQYAAAFGGFNFIEFGEDGRVLVNPLRVKPWVSNELEASTLLYYTGQSRESARIIEQQIENTREGRTASVEAMLALKEDASSMKEVILRGDLDRYPGILGRSWQAKKKMAAGITTPLIEQVYDSALDAGAQAGKISGAGGGGFMMFFVSPARRLDVVRALSRFPGELMNFHFTPYGVQSWAIG